MIPDDPIDRQLARLLGADMSPEDAAVKVLAPYGDTPLPRWAHPMVLQLARSLHRRRNRRREDAGFRPDARPDARHRLARTEFSLPDGRRLAWADLTVAELEVKAAWLRAHIDSLHVDLDRIERAIGLLSRYPAGTQLRDVEGWQDAIADPCERSGGDADPGDLSQAA